MADIFDIQDEIARAIAAQLKIKLGAGSDRPLVKRHTENLEAHSLYLKGLFYWYRQSTPEEMEKGRIYLEQAVAPGPGHVPALLNLAEANIARAFFGQSPALELWDKARNGFARIKDAEPECALAHAALGFIEAVGNYRWEQGFEKLDAVLRMNPALARALFWRTQLLHSMGRTEEALADTRSAIEVDPLFTLYHFYASFFCLNMGQPDGAETYYGKFERRQADTDGRARVGDGHLSGAMMKRISGNIICLQCSKLSVSREDFR
jgi:serine/threonine-protein kinase